MILSQRDVLDKEILQHLPDKDMTLSIAAITKLLSDSEINRLGCFEKKYMYDPIGEKEHSSYKSIPFRFDFHYC